MGSPFRILVVLLGAFFALQGLAWIVAPARVAQGLGMPLLDGLGRSTQIGDFASFFATAGILMILGSRPGRATLLYVPAGLFALAALGRTLAFALHGAELAAAFIGIELATAALLVAAAQASPPPAEDAPRKGAPS